MAISRQLAEAPSSPETDTAILWTLETARDYGWEDETLPLAERLVAASGDRTRRKDLGLALLALGQARNGDAAAASATFARVLAQSRFRQANTAAELAQSLALIWQLRGDIEAAQAVYEQLDRGFFANDEVKAFVETRQQRLSLWNQPAPPIRAADLDGKPLVWADEQGKTIVLDFWATNCRPCIEELPRLSRIAGAWSGRKVEFLGLSFDEDVLTVREFAQSYGLFWRQFLARPDAEESFRVRLIPCLMIVGPQGRLAAVDVRPVDLSATLHRLVGANPR